jgi:hypothetical protein
MELYNLDAGAGQAFQLLPKLVQQFHGVAHANIHVGFDVIPIILR